MAGEGGGHAQPRGARTGWADSEDADYAAGGFCCSFEAPLRDRPCPHLWPRNTAFPEREAGRGPVSEHHPRPLCLKATDDI